MVDHVRGLALVGVEFLEVLSIHLELVLGVEQNRRLLEIDRLLPQQAYTLLMLLALAPKGVPIIAIPLDTEINTLGDVLPLGLFRELLDLRQLLIMKVVLHLIIGELILRVLDKEPAQQGHKGLVEEVDLLIEETEHVGHGAGGDCEGVVEAVEGGRGGGELGVEGLGG